MDQDPIIRAIERLSVSPGDTVVLHAAVRLHAEQVAALYNRLSSCIPEGVKPLVLDSLVHPLQLIGAKPQPSADEMPELTSNTVNDACWELLERLPKPLGNENFNGLKQALYSALRIVHREHYAKIAAPQPPLAMPDWISYDDSSDVLTIHGRRYAAAMFGETGFLAPAGTVLRIEQGPDDVVTVSAEAQPTQAARDVLAERQRQIHVEGWTPEHDDEHGDGQMAMAAGSYCESAARSALFRRAPGAAFAMPKLWPMSWGTSWWRPKNPRADLVRAGALILAEIERLDRKAQAEQGAST